MPFLVKTFSQLFGSRLVAKKINCWVPMILMRLVLSSLLMLLNFVSTYKHQMNQLKTVLEQTESRLQSVDLQLEVEKRKTKTFESHIEYLKERVVTLETQLEKAEEVITYLMKS
jgi:septal ring factor EnvC (AmiA/AmiB activator)